MKKLKKCLAVLTAAFLILSNIPSVAVNAANDSANIQYSTADKENFKFSYNFYRTTGVIEAELNIDSTIPRGLWADIVLKYFGWGSAIDTKKDIHFFKDYDSKYEKTGAVNLAADLGLMGEYDDGKFCPDVDVSFEDACISLVKGLGYEMVAENRGGGVEQYILLANELGLLKGVTAVRGYPIVASAAMKMLDNTLETEMFGRDMGVDEVYKKGETVLEKVFRLSKGEGIVTSDRRSSLYTSEKSPDGQIGIDNVNYSYGGLCDGLVGYRVRYFVDINDNETVVYLGKLKNEVEIIDFSDIYDYTNRTYYYILDGTTKERKWEIPKECAVIYNGAAITDGFSSNLPMYTEDGSLTLIDNDFDGEEDVLLIEAYTNLWIGHIDSSSQTIYSYYDENEYISFNDYSEVELYDSYGAQTTLAKLSVKDVLSVAKTPDGDTVRIDVSTDTVEGEIKGLGSDGEKKFLELDGVKYFVSSVCSTEDISLGFSGVFYLNKKKQIVGFDEKLITPAGYLIRAGIDDTSGERVFLKLLTSSGEIKTILCADKVKVVGESGAYNSDRLYKLLLNGGTEVKQQVLLYDVNDKEEIVSLDLLSHSDRIRERATIKSSGIQYRSSASCFTDGKTFLNGGAIIFSVPMNGGEAEDYGVLYKSDLQNEQQYSSETLPMYAYQINGSQLGVDILVIDQSFRSRKYGLGIVKSIERTIDENDELCHIVKIYQYGNLNTYHMYDSDFDINSINAASSAFSARKLEEGDVVSMDYIPKSNNKILSRLTIIYDISNDEYLYSNPSVTNHTGVTRYFYGDVQTKDNKLMAVVLRGGTMAVSEETTVGENVDTSAKNYEIHTISGNVYVYDSSLKKDNLIKGSANDIAAYDTVGKDYSTVWIFTSNEASQMIYVVNK